MKKSIIKSIALFLIILISIFFGYENPELIESTKSIFKVEEKIFEIDEEKIKQCINLCDFKRLKNLENKLDKKLEKTSEKCRKKRQKKFETKNRKKSLE